VGFTSQQFGVGTVSQLIAQPTGPGPILVQVVAGAGTIVVGGSVAPGPSPTGLQITTASGIVSLPCSHFGAISDVDDGLYARATAGGTATLAVFDAI
jgi:hypothetical protein